VDALRVAVACLQAQHPVLADALGRAQAVLLDGRYFPEEDGRALVLASDDQGYYLVNGHCTCPAASHHPETICKHRIARKLYDRIAEKVVPAPSDEERLMSQPTVHVAVDAALPATDPPHAGTGRLAESVKIPRQWIQLIHGKEFVRYPGLLAMAHEAGLRSLSVRFVSVSETLAVAEAVATFADGRTFAECADATPANVPAEMQPHFPRLAATRAKARCLRDALNICMCSVEELE
jgi:hypothetical protein